LQQITIMQSILKSIITLIIIIISLTQSARGQDHVLNVQDGYSLIGVHKETVENFLTILKFKYDNHSSNIYDFSKTQNDQNVHVTVAYNNTLVRAVSWNEYWNNVPGYTYLLETKLGFKGETQTDIGGVRTITYKNNKQSLLATIIYNYNSDITRCSISIGHVEKDVSKKSKQVPSISKNEPEVYKLINQLPNPRNLKLTTPLKFKT
jgi:hypothetical protein